MRKGVLLLFILVSFLSVRANNVQLQGTVKVISVAGGVATLEVDLEWENSWRDDFNWDGVWLFFKHKSGVDGAWTHAAIDATGAVVTGGDYTTMSGTTGATANGLFVYPSKHHVGHSGSLKVQVQWKTSYTQAKFDANDVFIVAHGIEMVYIPYGVYTIGDGSSTGTFDKISKELYGLIPESSDVVNNTSGYVITASAQNGADAATNAADHLNSSVYPTGSWHVPLASAAAWWKIDFKTPKTIRYFGISGATSHPTLCPTVVWHFEGSNDDVNWTQLSVFDPGVWRATATSYPVQQSLRVDKPGAYRYYRVNFPSSNYPVVQNIAMTEDELCAGCGFTGDFVDAESSRAYSAGGNTFTLLDAFPKGYQGFYVMKYETSQEEYVEFLNTLTLAEQTALIPGVDALNVGDFVFGANKSAPNYRNGVILADKKAGKSLRFDNNLNNNEVHSEEGDGGSLAMNYMSITDAQGYASWAGLRPMTEMEYEKACRRPYPQEPQAGEFAWNSAVGAVNATGLTMEGSGRETTATGNVNAGGTINGPVRCGAFARSSSPTQASTGCSYWGVMEMSGNVSELCANITNTTISKTGNGTGAYNASLFGSGPASGYGTRGGGFSDTHTTLTTSSRVAVSRFTDALERDSTVGFRCSFTNNAAGGVSAGTIADVAAICPGDRVTFSGTPATAGALDVMSYVWSVNINNGGFAIIRGESGAELVYSDFAANTTYVFKRKAICPVGEAEVVSKSYVIPNTTLTLSSTSTMIDACGGIATVIATSAGTVSWSYKGTSLNTTNTYTPSHDDFSNQSGTFEVICSAIISGCSSEARLQVGVSDVVNSTDVTLANCGLVNMKDVVDGNMYCIKLTNDGSRCWMTQNMRRTDVAYSYPNNDASYAIAHGCRYYWNTAMQGSTAAGAQGICPEGWHIPTDGEWNVLHKPGGASEFNITMSGYDSNSLVGNLTKELGISGFYISSSTFVENSWGSLVLRFSQRYYANSGGGSWQTGNIEGYRFSLRCVLD